MKRNIFNLLVMGSLAFSSIAVQAGGALRTSDGSPVMFRGEELNGPVKQGYMESTKGAGIGAIAGAVVAGPAGLVVGMAGGALIGHQIGLEEELAKMQNQMDSLKQEKMQLESANDQIGASKRQLETNLNSLQESREKLLTQLAKSYLLSVHFRTESSQLEQRYYPYLERLRMLVSQEARLDIHIDAHTDARGSQSYNSGLSERRANAVSRFFETSGISSSRISIKIHGERLAEYGETDQEGNALDRQVLITLCLKRAS